MISVHLIAVNDFVWTRSSLQCGVYSYFEIASTRYRIEQNQDKKVQNKLLSEQSCAYGLRSIDYFWLRADSIKSRLHASC